MHCAFLFISYIFFSMEFIESAHHPNMSDFIACKTSQSCYRYRDNVFGLSVLEVDTIMNFPDNNLK